MDLVISNSLQKHTDGWQLLQQWYSVVNAWRNCHNYSYVLLILCQNCWACHLKEERWVILISRLSIDWVMLCVSLSIIVWYSSLVLGAEVDQCDNRTPVEMLKKANSEESSWSCHSATQMLTQILSRWLSFHWNSSWIPCYELLRSHC